MLVCEKHRKTSGAFCLCDQRRYGIMSDLQIKQVNINAVKAYKNNPRNNKKAVKYVAESIKKFGFKIPIVLDNENVIVCGHTRLLAAKKLGITEVPCVIADDLNPEEIKMFRLADNKVSEKATWDIDKLGIELEDLQVNFDIESLGFDILINDDCLEDKEPEDNDSYYGDERERTYKEYNLHEYDKDRAAGIYNLPVLKRCNFIPYDLIGFNYMLTSKKKDKGIHFFLDDYQFERIWNDPDAYIDKLLSFPCCLTPDFSLYLDMPMAMKIWNVYRSRLIGQMIQDRGGNVIPTLQWADKETFKFAFDGIEKGGTVAVSTVGVMKNEEACKIWTAGMDEAIRQVEPSAIVLYGSDIDYDFGDINVVKIKARKFS